MPVNCYARQPKFMRTDDCGTFDEWASCAQSLRIGVYATRDCVIKSTGEPVLGAIGGHSDEGGEVQTPRG